MKIEERVINVPQSLHEGIRQFSLHFGRLAALGMMSSFVVHEVRNSMAVISGNAQILLLKEDEVNREDLKTRLEMILAQIDRVMEVADKVGSFSGRASGEEILFSPETSLENALTANLKLMMDLDVKVERNEVVSGKSLSGDASVFEFLLMELIRILLENSNGAGELRVVSAEEDSGWRLLLTRNSILISENDLDNAVDTESNFTVVPALISAERFHAECRLIKTEDETGFGLTVPW